MVLSIVLLCFGLGLIVIAIAITNRTREFLTKAVSADGIVVRLRAREDADYGKLHSPVIEYQTADGNTATYEPEIYWGHKQGDSVPILYSAEQPGEVRIQSFRSLWAPPVALGVVGSIFVVIGASFLIWNP